MQRHMTSLKCFGFLRLSTNSSTLFTQFQQTQTMRHSRKATKYLIYSIHIQSLMPAQHFHEEITHQNRGNSGSLKRHDWWDEDTLHTDRHCKLFLKPCSPLASERSCLFLSTAITFWHSFSSTENSVAVILCILNYLNFLELCILVGRDRKSVV